MALVRCRVLLLQEEFPIAGWRASWLTRVCDISLWLKASRIPSSLSSQSPSCLYFPLPSSSPPVSSFSECWVGRQRKPHSHSSPKLPNLPNTETARSRDRSLFHWMGSGHLLLLRAIPLSNIRQAHHRGVIPAESAEYLPSGAVFTANQRIIAQESTAYRYVSAAYGGLGT